MITAVPLSDSTVVRAVGGGNIIGEGGPTIGNGSDTPDTGDNNVNPGSGIGIQPIGRTAPPGPPPITVIVQGGGGGDNTGGSTGPAAATPVAEAKSSLDDAISELGTLFASMGSTSPTSSPADAQPVGTVQVSQTPTTDTTSGTGKSVIIIAGLVIGLGYLGYQAYKSGWFGKKKESSKEE